MEFHRYPTLLTQHTHAKMKVIYEKRKEILNKIKTKTQALQYKKLVQKKIKKCFGRFPNKTPLNAEVTKTLNFELYTLECIKYESRPNFWVSANLYLPKKKVGKFPGVLLPCGHDHMGKGANSYIRAAVKLVQAGYAVLVYDPINQGERKIYSLLGFPQESPVKFNATIGHNHIGKQLRACGESLSAWMVWDGIRSLDYLFSRPEIDQKRIGVTGNSGGGALSAFLWALDQRIRMVASSCWTTSYLFDIENEMPGDNEQYPIGMLAEGLDKIDFFMARAGEPAILLGQERDFFDDRGLKNGYDELLKLHLLLGGNKKTCCLQMDTVTHSFSPINQDAMVRFFNTALGLKPPTILKETIMPTQEEVLVTKSKDLHKEGSQPIYQLVAQLSKKMSKNQKKNTSLKSRICECLKFEVPKTTPAYRRTHGEGRWDRETLKSKLNVFRFVIESEPQIFLPLRHVTATKGPFRLDPDSEIKLFLPNLCSQSELENAWTKNKKEFWILDVRGMGEGLFVEDDTKIHYGIEYSLTGHALMFGETLLGKRVYDVLAAIQLFKAEGVKKIHLYGNGQGAILALIVALFDKSIISVNCEEGPKSFEELNITPVCYWLDVNFPLKVLEYFDLPEIRKSLGKKLLKYKFGSPVGIRFK